MVCYDPRTAFAAQTTNANGKRNTTFQMANANRHPITGAIEERTLPCGQCIGCRLDSSKEWAARCTHEALFHEENSFITLTFADQNLPASGSVSKDDTTKFMKRLRKELAPKKIRFLAVGEYGDKLQRPHYHALIFGHEFPDRELHGYSKSGEKMYRSPTLEKVWKYGYSTVQDFSYKNAAYCARYATKKITGRKAKDHYQGRHPEFHVQSNRPGIGQLFYKHYADDIYPHDTVVINGKEHKVPRYYDKLLDKDNPRELELYKEVRRYKASQHKDEQTKERRAVRKECQERRANLLQRGMEANV